MGALETFGIFNLSDPWSDARQLEQERELRSPVPPTSTYPATPVASGSTPGDSGGDATDQRCQRELQSKKPGLNSRLASEGWSQEDVPTRMPDGSD
jgi:hypothetical protein